MIVTCPGCDSNYRVPNEKVPRGGARMRCPQCTTEFLAMLPDDPGSEEPPPKPRIPPPPAAASAPPVPPSSAHPSSAGFPLPPGTAGTLPLTAPRPNPFAKPTASQPARVFGEASLPPGGGPPAATPSLSPLAGQPPLASPETHPATAPASPPIPPTPPPAAVTPAPTPPPAPSPGPIASPFAPGPPPPPAAASAPAPAPAAAPPRPPPAAFASPSTPPPAPPDALGAGLGFDPLADELFIGPEGGDAAIPREITGLFSQPPGLGSSPPQPPLPPPEQPRPQPPPSPPPAALATPPPQPPSPFALNSPSTGAGPSPSAGHHPDPFGDESSPPSGGAPLAGTGAGDDDLFAALFDLPEGPPEVPPASGASPSPNDATPTEGKANMKATLARAMEAKGRVAALKEDHSPLRRGEAPPPAPAPEPSDPAASPPAAPPPAVAPAATREPPAAPPAAKPTPPKPARRRASPSLKEGAAWGMLLASTIVLVCGVIFTAWTTGLVPLDDVLMPHAEEHLGVHPPWSYLGRDEVPLAELEKAAARARESKDLALEAAAWRRVLASAPEHEEAQRRLGTILSKLGDARARDNKR